ncbi:MAG: hypothetical protein LAT83_08625 [Kiritimatiellae bacterium]|nr:hypothetical protein [Kiritimatiellia bacterium]
MLEEGQFARLTLTDGHVISGVIQQIGAVQLRITLPDTGDQPIMFRQLSQESRIRVDRNERAALIQERATEEALRRRPPH